MQSQGALLESRASLCAWCSAGRDLRGDKAALWKLASPRMVRRSQEMWEGQERQRGLGRVPPCVPPRMHFAGHTGTVLWLVNTSRPFRLSAKRPSQPGVTRGTLPLRMRPSSQPRASPGTWVPVPAARPLHSGLCCSESTQGLTRPSPEPVHPNLESSP